MIRSTARATISSHLKYRDQERSTMFPQLHIMQNNSIQIHTARMQPRFRRSSGSQHLLVCTGSSSPHPQHPPHCPAFCWCVWIRGISGTRFQLRAVCRTECCSGQGMFLSWHVPPPVSESVCLPGRGCLKLQGEQGQQVQRGFTGCLLGHLHHRDIPKEQKS